MILKNDNEYFSHVAKQCWTGCIDFFNYAYEYIEQI